MGTIADDIMLLLLFVVVVVVVVAVSILKMVTIFIIRLK